MLWQTGQNDIAYSRTKDTLLFIYLKRVIYSHNKEFLKRRTWQYLLHKSEYYFIYVITKEGS